MGHKRKKKEKRAGRRPEDGRTAEGAGAGPVAPPDPAPDAPYGRLVNRYLDTLEEQLRAKDAQLRAADERLQDAFELQRALALLVKAYERRTGLLADAVWDEVPDGDLAGEGPSAEGREPARAAAAPPPEPEAAPSREAPHPAPGSFTDWLRRTRADAPDAPDA
jgi:hypothetical protein